VPRKRSIWKKWLERMGWISHDPRLYVIPWFNSSKFKFIKF
jgi:hypothetical protein